MTQERLYTLAEMAEFLQVSDRTVRRLCVNWPHLDFGPKTKRFTEEQRQQILAMNSKEPAAPRTTRRRRTN